MILSLRISGMSADLYLVLIFFSFVTWLTFLIPWILLYLWVIYWWYWWVSEAVGKLLLLLFLLSVTICTIWEILWFKLEKYGQNPQIWTWNTQISALFLKIGLCHLLKPIGSIAWYQNLKKSYDRFPRKNTDGGHVWNKILRYCRHDIVPIRKQWC